MHCLVTAGPSVELLDQVRRLTNHSTGRLGSQLCDFLLARGHSATLCLSETALIRPQSAPNRLIRFSSGADLAQYLEELSTGTPFERVFHAAALCDFTFGSLWRRLDNGRLAPAPGHKPDTRQGPLLAELLPTPKIIAHLRSWFPQAQIVGWKYEVDGDALRAQRRGSEQIRAYRTDACVVNGPAYGSGFLLVDAAENARHCPSPEDLFENLLGPLPLPPLA